MEKAGQFVEGASGVSGASITFEFTDAGEPGKNGHAHIHIPVAPPRRPSRTARLLLGVAVAAASALILSQAAALASPACGSTITTSVKLNSDMTCTGTGLVVGASNITIDLNGHTITGPGSSSSFAGIIDFTGHSGVTVTNGTIRKFSNGVDLTDAVQNQLIDLAVDDTLFAIVIRGGHHNVIIGNAIPAAASGGIVIVSGSTANRIERNAIGNIAGAGNAITLNNDADRNLVERNTAFSNSGNGIVVFGRNNVLRANQSQNNTGDRIRIASSATGTVVLRNIANNNANDGINAVAGVTDGGRNHASGNGFDQCVNVACTP